MDDDLNVPAALAVLHETVRRATQRSPKAGWRRPDGALHQVHAMTPGPGPERCCCRPGGGDGAKPAPSPPWSSAQLDARTAARADKDWAAVGRHPGHPGRGGIVVVADGPDGATWSLTTRLSPRIRPD